MRGAFISRNVNIHRIIRVEMVNNECVYLHFEDNTMPLSILLTDRIKKAFQEEDWNFFDFLGQKEKFETGNTL